VWKADDCGNIGFEMDDLLEESRKVGGAEKRNGGNECMGTATPARE
jgi:hypothetical protein